MTDDLQIQGGDEPEDVTLQTLLNTHPISVSCLHASGTQSTAWIPCFSPFSLTQSLPLLLPHTIHSAQTLSFPSWSMAQPLP